MPIDSARYPDLPPGAKLQPTADPETAYVLADDAATGKRTSIGIIRHGVFTPAPQYALVAAQAEFSKAAEEPAAPMPAAVSTFLDTPKNGQIPKNCASTTLLTNTAAININIYSI